MDATNNFDIEMFILQTTVYDEVSCTRGFQNCMTSEKNINNKALSFIPKNKNECRILSKAIGCLIEESTYDNGCNLEDIRSDTKDYLTDWSQNESFSSCGFRKEHIDEIMRNKSNSIFSNTFIVFLVILIILAIAFIVFTGLFLFKKLKLRKKENFDLIKNQDK